MSGAAETPGALGDTKMARIVRTSPTAARMTLSRTVSSLFDCGADGPAIHSEVQAYQRAARDYLRAHPSIESVEVYMSARYGGSQNDIIERA